MKTQNIFVSECDKTRQKWSCLIKNWQIWSDEHTSVFGGMSVRIANTKSPFGAIKPRAKRTGSKNCGVFRTLRIYRAETKQKHEKHKIPREARANILRKIKSELGIWDLRKIKHGTGGLFVAKSKGKIIYITVVFVHAKHDFPVKTWLQPNPS